jgi:hypothetical protein
VSASDTKALAYARALRALQHIEAAQNEIAKAAQELSGLVHGSTAYDKAWKLHDQVHRGWYAVRNEIERKRAKLDLDGMAAAERCPRL